MKISQELLVHELSTNQEIQEKCNVTFSCDEEFSEMKYSGICCFEKQIKFHRNTLYLINIGELKMEEPIADFNNDVLLCLINGSKTQIIEMNFPIINFQLKAGNINIKDLYHQLFTIIFGIFQKYDHWQDQINQAVENEELQELLEVSYPIFNRSIYVADDQPEYLGAAGPCLDYQGSGSQIPLEIFNYLKNDLNNRPPNSEQKPFIYPRGILCADSLCLDIFINQDYFCRLILIDEINKSSFLKSDYHLLEILGRSLSFLINRRGLRPKRKKINQVSQNLIEAFNNLLNGQLSDINSLNPLLIRNGWKPEEQLCVGYLFLYPSEVQIKSATYYCRYILEHFPGIIPLEKNDHLILVIRESYYFSRQCSHDENYLSDLILFIRDCNFRIGLSNNCQDLKRLPYYGRQAEIALNHGLIDDETVWCHHFSNYAFDYLLQEACQAMPVELLCAPELIFLKQYDDAKKTEYFLTLKTYLNHQMNASQTAKALFIHQATMVYRLKRLLELINIDFTNADQMLFLHLSYKMLENNERTEF